MVTAAWDTSNLVALYKDGKQCTSCCTPAGGYAPISYCVCFTGDEWNSVTPYNIGNTVVHGGIYWNCIQAHTNQEPPNASYWDSLSPFGGPGKAPGIYTLTIVGVTVYPRINGTWNIPWYSHFANQCHWIMRIDIDGISTNFEFSPSQPTPFLEIKDVPHNDRIFWVFNIPWCGLIRDDIANQVGTGTVSWRPGEILPWDSDTNYTVMNKVGHEGTFYSCIADHSNQEPPNASYWEVY